MKGLLIPAVFFYILNQLKGLIFVILNFVFFTVKIERSTSSDEEQVAKFKQAELFRQREEAFFMDAAQYPDFVSRV